VFGSPQGFKLQLWVVVAIANQKIFTLQENATNVDSKKNWYVTDAIIMQL